ncbi:MAG TPA: hypothetical protein VHN19_02250 [Burkholderiales bacterium]|nr:hypothetical protein [Burkholderiales bacterium]
MAERDYVIFQDLCKKFAVDKIVRRVHEVDAVFQMRARDPSGEVTHRENQYTMDDPFGAIGDVGSGHGPGAYLDWRFGNYYDVFERPKTLGATNGPPYLRFIANVDKAAPIGHRRLEIRREEEGVLQSKYGYSWEDISTQEMRDRWIAGGRIRILDLKAGELIAERTGFYFARRLNGALTKHPWGGAGESCPQKHSTSEFVKSVLIPKNL